MVSWSEGRWRGKAEAPKSSDFYSAGKHRWELPVCDLHARLAACLPRRAEVGFSSPCLWHRPSSEPTGEDCATVTLPSSIIHALLPLSVFLHQPLAPRRTRAHKIDTAFNLRRVDFWVCCSNGSARSAALGTALCWDAHLAVPCAFNLVFILRVSAPTTAAWRISSGGWINYRPMTLPDYWAEQLAESDSVSECNRCFWMKGAFFSSFLPHLVFLICCEPALMMNPIVAI